MLCLSMTAVSYSGNAAAQDGALPYLFKVLAVNKTLSIQVLQRNLTLRSYLIRVSTGSS